MTGNRLPSDLDLVSLAQTETNQIFVIVESGQGGTGGGNGHGTRPPTGITTGRPSRRDFQTVTFTTRGSYLRLPQWSPGRRSGRIEFRFKTILRHGLMMVTSRSGGGRSDFFAVELSDGDLYALFNLGGRTQRFLVGAGVNDGREHHVVIERNGRSLVYGIDGERHSEQLASGDDGSLDLGSTFFVGGTPNPLRLPWWLYSRMRDSYRGCLWDLSFDGGEIVELEQLRRDQGMVLMRSGQ